MSGKQANNLPYDCPKVTIHPSRTIHRTWVYAHINGWTSQHKGTLIEIKGLTITIREDDGTLVQLLSRCLTQSDVMILDAVGSLPFEAGAGVVHRSPKHQRRTGTKRKREADESGKDEECSTDEGQEEALEDKQ
ncbi:uncharacterized protein LTR77_002821 [Saxophila tyrrhenica]|uniref:Uncharacterized protein n=1 Tax=Saxophila tyrrhenica TaxID=1690608 RepID=A0AAV9PFQ3_9PEZI|nr:hypothetical protein LTR77_002821 [Saxophila tyrrhenica]